jgi:PRC-barrel domain
MNQIRGCAALALVAALSSCSSMRPAPPAPALPKNPAPAAEPAETNPPKTSSEHSPPSSANAAVPTCVPPESKSKPKVTAKTKSVRQEAPPELPTGPVVAGTPPGGVVDAQVRRMPVPVMSILGKRVQGPKGDDLGRVVDVLADASGRVRIAIIDFGGFLGVGDRRIAVDWPLLRFNPDGGDPSLLLSVERDKLKAAPEYKDTPRPQTLMEPAAPAAADVATPTDGVTAPADNKK